MVSFRAKFADGLKKRGIEVTGDLDDPRLDAVLVIGGTRNLAGFAAGPETRRSGCPAPQRHQLDAPCARHRRSSLPAFGIW